MVTEAQLTKLVETAHLARMPAGTPMAANWRPIGDAPQMGMQDISGFTAAYDDTMDIAEIISAARKHNGAELIKEMLEVAKRKIQVERMEARAAGIDVERVRQSRVREIRQRCFDERVVCGFIAEVRDSERSGNGLPYEMIWSLNSLTLIKIVEALEAAGYRPHGKVHVQQQDEENASQG